MTKKTTFLISGLLTLALLVACSGMPKQEKSLYERLGGKEAITAVVNHLWTVVAKDDRINHYFANTNPDVFAGQMIDFLCQGTGGPCVYKGKDMYAAHTGMHLSNADFDALAEDTVQTLNHFKVPQQEQDEVMKLLGGMRESIINH